MFQNRKSISSSDKSVLEAIDTTQAVIGFNADGIIQHANDVFLAATGYSRADVVGKHHKMFVDEAYRASSDYQQFWADLGDGHAKTGEFRRVKKDGSVLWLQATYTPIRSSSGDVKQIVKFATDITKAKTEAAQNKSWIAAIDKSQAIIEFTTEGVILDANQNFLQAMGYSKEEIVGQHHRMFVDKDEASSKAYKKLWANLASGEGFSGRIKRFAKNQIPVWLEASYNPILDEDGTVRRVLKVASDVTLGENLRAEAEQTLEQALDGVVKINENNIVTFFNAAAEKLWGRKRDEVIGKNVKMLVPVEMQANHDDYVNANRETGQDKIVGTSRDVPITRPDGTEVWGQLSLSKIRLNGKITYTAFLKDVTVERAQREEISQTLEQALDGVVKIDESNIVTFFNAAAEKLWGYSRDEVIGQNVKMLVPAEMQSNHDSFVNRNRDTGEDKIVGIAREVPVYRKDGSQLWGQLSLSKVLVDGKITYTAFVKDVTESRAQREQIQTLSLVANETDNSVVITTADGLIEYVNPGFERMTGFSVEEVMGKKPGDVLQGADTDPQTVANIRAKLAAKMPFYDEILNYTKTGEPYWISLSINPVLNEDGEVHRFISIQANVTETKTAALETRARMQCIEQANAVVEWSPRGDVLSFNDFFHDITSGMGKEALHQHFALDRLLSTDDKTKLLNGASVSTDVQCETADGHDAWLSATFMPLTDYSGQVTRLVMYATDSTARRTAIQSTTTLMRDVLQQIDGVADEINAVTSQTHLLSLNATIEASRAGNAGKGFAVVADEVRALAGRTGASTSEIAKLITSTQGKIDELANVI
ncbi:MAG: PAS domain S-box protein [Sphingomonadales bacterium]